jgi:hypothetical protein
MLLTGKVGAKVGHCDAPDARFRVFDDKTMSWRCDSAESCAIKRLEE